jgi:hypothetical protein
MVGWIPHLHFVAERAGLLPGSGWAPSGHEQDRQEQNTPTPSDRREIFHQVVLWKFCPLTGR